ncbi:MAG TPA: holo-ACP synthase [Longimicrobiales bacterium]
MIVGTGFDLVAIDRFARFLLRHGGRGAERLFTPSEAEYCRSHVDPVVFYAARFAAKEAFYKALGTGVGSAGSWKDVEVVRLASGRPRLMLHGRAAARAHQAQVRTIHLSLSHTDEAAGAFVILEA